MASCVVEDSDQSVQDRRFWYLSRGWEEAVAITEKSYFEFRVRISFYVSHRFLCR